MPAADPFDVLVDRATRGDQPALEALMPLVYGELRRLAAHYLRGERPGQTLQPTSLVHEVYLRLLKDRPERWQNAWPRAPSARIACSTPSHRSRRPSTPRIAMASCTAI